MLVDTNILLYAIDDTSRQHETARSWVEHALNGTRRIGLPWSVLIGFVRIATNPRAMTDPLAPSDAWTFVEDWLAAPTVWVPEPGPGHGQILGRLISELDLRGNLISDAALAAICIEHGLQMVSADSDFARFPEISWVNPFV